jgi:hypothetical protein
VIIRSFHAAISTILLFYYSSRIISVRLNIPVYSRRHEGFIKRRRNQIIPDCAFRAVNDLRISKRINILPHKISRVETVQVLCSCVADAVGGVTVKLL